MKNIINIFFLLIILSVQIGKSLIPVERFSQSSVLVDKKIYFFGGVSNHAPRFSPFLNQIIYLDVSKPFNITNPPFEEVSNVSIPFGSAFATLLLDSPKNIIYLFGGIMRNVDTDKDDFKSILHMFNLKTNEWNIPKTIGIEPIRRRDISSVINNNVGKFFVFSGVTDQFTGSQVVIDSNITEIFDMTYLSWSNGSPLNAPFGRTGYTTTLLPNGLVVFIGGKNSQLIDVPIDQLPIYNTNANNWSLLKTRGPFLENRNKHSAILTPDGRRIIIFGGEKGDGQGAVTQQLAVLNATALPFEWSIPQVFQVSATAQPPQLVRHSATLVENYMLINFGNNSLVNTEEQIPFCYIFDIRNFTWVLQFEPEQVLPNNPSGSSNNYIIIVTLSFALGIVVSIVGLFGYEFYKKRQHHNNAVYRKF